MILLKRFIIWILFASLLLLALLSLSETFSKWKEESAKIVSLNKDQMYAEEKALEKVNSVEISDAVNREPSVADERAPSGVTSNAIGGASSLDINSDFVEKNPEREPTKISRTIGKVHALRETPSFSASSKVPKLPPAPKIINPFSETQDQRKSTLNTYCERTKPIDGKIDYAEGFLYNTQQKLIYCRVPKVACSTWKRVLIMFEGFQKHIREIPMEQVHSFPLKYLQQLNESEIEEKIHRYYSFMFTRHPHDRLFSAYRNKIMDPKGRTAYLEFFGPYMVYTHLGSVAQIDEYVKKNSIDTKEMKVTFEQFVRFVLKSKPGNLLKGLATYDTHWQPQTDICKVCNFTFDHIGKFETMYEDAKVIFGKLNQPKVYEMFQNGDDSVYKKKATSLVKKYYEELPKDLLPKIYEYYKGDFEAFRYDPHFYIHY